MSMSVSSDSTLAELPRAILAQSHPFLCLSQSCTGGVIICNDYYSDLICPGASLKVVTAFPCTAVYVMGQVQLGIAKTTLAKALIYRRRVESIKTLQRMISLPDRTQRANMLVAALCRRFGLEAVRSVPAAAIAQLVAVPATDIELAWEHYHQHLQAVARTQRLGDPDRLAWETRLATQHFGPRPNAPGPDGAAPHARTSPPLPLPSPSELSPAHYHLI